MRKLVSTSTVKLNEELRYFDYKMNQEGSFEILDGAAVPTKKAVDNGIDATITNSILGLQKLLKKRELDLE